MNTSFCTSKVAVITGASSDNGKETVRRYLADGYVVHAAGSRLDEMADIERDGAILHFLDLDDCASIRACAAAIMAYGQLIRASVDVVVNEDGQTIYSADEALRQHADNCLFDLAGAMDRLKSLFLLLPAREPQPAVVKAACL